LFEKQDMIKGPFFLIVAMAYIPVAFWMLKSPNSSVPYVVTIAGTIGIIILYAVTRTDMAIALGMEAGNVGHLGMVSKALQFGVVIGSVWALIQTKKDNKIQNQCTSEVRKQ
jgi:NADH:ubiquinone oxidoreductase subunit 6 (subunit J)